MDKKPVVKVLEVGAFSTNCYIVGIPSDWAFIIDPGDEKEKITRLIKKYKFSPKFIINTHAHIDHIKEDESFFLPVYLHYKDVPFLTEPNLNLSSFLSELFVFKSRSLVKPLKDGDSIEIDSWKIEVIHTPGHTPGSICLRLGNYLFSGDTLFCNSVGRTDFEGGNRKLLISSIREKLFPLEDSLVVFPGHGPSTTLGREKKENPFLQDRY